MYQGLLALSAKPIRKKFANKEKLHLLGVDYTFPIWLASTDLKVGHPVLVVYNEKYKDISSVYFMNENNFPFQVSGTIDRLLDCENIINYTEDYIKHLRYGEILFDGIYNELNNQEMMNNSKAIKYIEETSMIEIVSKKMEWNDIKYYLRNIWSSSINNYEINRKVRKSLLSCIKPDNIDPISINLSGYNCKITGG